MFISLPASCQNALKHSLSHKLLKMLKNVCGLVSCLYPGGEVYTDS